MSVHAYNPVSINGASGNKIRDLITRSRVKEAISEVTPLPPPIWCVFVHECFESYAKNLRDITQYSLKKGRLHLFVLVVISREYIFIKRKYIFLPKSKYV
jgi:hypothetical protein